MRLPRSGRMPPTDGVSHWRYPVQSDVMLRAKSQDELIEAIFDFRIRNNISPGDPEGDISRWYCAQFPGFCHAEASDTDPAAARISTEPMLNRVSRWASVSARQMPKGGYELVPKAEADSRAVICAACRKQDSGWRGGCGGCSASTMQILQQLKKLRTTPKDGNLGACSIAGWANVAAAWLPVSALPITEEQRAALPEACWRKKIL